MKRFVLTLMAAVVIVGLMHCEGHAYTNVSGPEAYELYTTYDDLVVVDVRENYEYCPRHIPCAINYPYNSGVFAKEYDNLPTDVPILVVCASGGRSGRAASALNQHGYEDVYSLIGGMPAWRYETATCDNPGNCDPAYLVYFPHIASGNGWETEISIINTSTDTPLTGTFKTYDADGVLLDDTNVLELPAAGRVELVVGESFSNPTQIRYIILETTSQTTYAYIKFYDYPGLKYRAAIPATTNVTKNNISVSHIALEDGWWTGIALVNTTTENRELTFTFNNGESQTLSLPAKAHRAINLTDFLEGLSTENLKSAIISNTEGIIGLEMFSNSMQLSGTLFKDGTSTTLYYPHIANDNEWWTGIAAFNPGSIDGELIIYPYAADGTLLSPAEPATPTGIAALDPGLVDDTLLSPASSATPIKIAAESNFVKSTIQLQLPENTAWMKIEANVPINGFELFGTTDGNQLAGYSNIDINSDSGIFPKNSHSDWTGLAIANTTSGTNTVTLKAYKDDGTLVSTTSLTLDGYQKSSDIAGNFFAGDIETATYISYSATAPVVAFQINGNGNMLDALPGRQ